MTCPECIRLWERSEIFCPSFWMFPWWACFSSLVRLVLSVRFTEVVCDQKVWYYDWRRYVMFHFFFLKLKCTGEEKRLERCAHNGWGNHSCSHDEDAGVRCTGPDTTRECVTECGDGYYLKNGKRQCAACSSSCLTCEDSPDACTSCDSSKFLRKTGMLKKWRHFSHAKCYYRILVSVDLTGHFHDDDIWVQLPQFISSLLSYLN